MTDLSTTKKMLEHLGIASKEYLDENPQIIIEAGKIEALNNIASQLKNLEGTIDGIIKSDQIKDLSDSISHLANYVEEIAGNQ